MFRCNLPDLGSVISGDLEVSVFQKFATAQSAQTVQFNLKYIYQAFEANPTGNHDCFILVFSSNISTKVQVLLSR